MSRRGLILVGLLFGAGALQAQTVPLPLAANVANLPNCGSARNGMVYGVRDALSPVVGDVVVGGGAVRVVVQCDTSAAGIKWVVQAPGAGGGGGASSFDELDSGTNTTAAMVVGTGASLSASGSGTIAATSATTATTATTANAGDSATAFFSAGTIEHERGGLEANVSAFAGLVRIASGSTTAVTNLSGLNTALGSSIADGAHTTDTDTTCLDAGVSCLFAASASEGGAASSVATDAVGTAGLDDDANTPIAGSFVVVETGAASFDYVAANAGTDVTADLEEEAHAAEHQNGGGDEVATATAGANAIPKAGAGGTLADGWIASSNVTQHEAALEGVLDLADMQGDLALGTKTSGGYAASTTEAGGATSLEANAVDAITEIAAALKTGADGELVTGTAGLTDECAKWNVDGDLVSAGAACGSGGGGGAMPALVLGWEGANLIPRNAAGAITPLGLDEGTSWDVNTRDFDDSADFECAAWSIAAGKLADIDTTGTVTFSVEWYAATAATANVMWFVTEIDRAAGENWDTAGNTEAATASAADTTQDETTITTWTETVATLAWAAGDAVRGELCRDGNHASDTLTGDARVLTFSVTIPRAE